MRRQDVVAAVLAVAAVIILGVILHQQRADNWLTPEQKAMAYDAAARIDLCEQFLTANGLDAQTDEDLKLARVLLYDFRTRKPYKFVIERIEKHMGVAYERARAGQE